MAEVTLRGKVQHTSGDLPQLGEVAPDFMLTTPSLKDVSLNDYAGLKKVFYFVPSLDTPVCAKTTLVLDEQMAAFPGAKALLVSADLPFALGRFCGAEKLKNVQALSTFRAKTFAEDYGVGLIDGPLAGLLARAVLVLDESNTVVYRQLLSEIADEPDFSQALALL